MMLAISFSLGTEAFELCIALLVSSRLLLHLLEGDAIVGTCMERNRVGFGLLEADESV